jgi:hypothetical protein
MRETDAKPRFRGGHRFKIGGRIVEVAPVRERCRQQLNAVLHLLRIAFCQDNDVGSSTSTHPVPQTAVAHIIMVVWQQSPAAGIALHPGQCLDDGSVFRAFGIEHVASYQHVAGIMDASGLTNGVDRIEAGFEKSHPDVEF